MTQHALAALSDRNYAILLEQAKDKNKDVDELAGELITEKIETEMCA